MSFEDVEPHMEVEGTKREEEDILRRLVDSLDENVWLKIFSNLKTKEILKSCSPVCKQFRSLTQELTATIFDGSFVWTNIITNKVCCIPRGIAYETFVSHKHL